MELQSLHCHGKFSAFRAGKCSVKEDSALVGDVSGDSAAL